MVKKKNRHRKGKPKRMFVVVINEWEDSEFFLFFLLKKTSLEYLMLRRSN